MYTGFPGKLTFYVRVLKSIACAALVRKAARFLLKSFGEEKINELVVTGNRLTSRLISWAWLQVALDPIWLAGRQLDHAVFTDTIGARIYFASYVCYFEKQWNSIMLLCYGT